MAYLFHAAEWQLFLSGQTAYVMQFTTWQMLSIWPDWQRIHNSQMADSSSLARKVFIITNLGEGTDQRSPPAQMPTNDMPSAQVFLLLLRFLALNDCPFQLTALW